MTKLPSTGRLYGLDLARFVAFVGMVIVNFKIAMGADSAGILGMLTGGPEGRAAARSRTFAARLASMSSHPRAAP